MFLYNSGHWCIAWWSIWNRHRFYCSSVSNVKLLEATVLCFDIFTHSNDCTKCVCRENVGLLGLTRVGSRRVVQVSAGFMIFFSTLGIFLLGFTILLYNHLQSCDLILTFCCLLWAGKFGAVFASIPVPIYAALHCVLFGLVGKTITKLNKTISSSQQFITCVFFLAAAVGLSFLQFTNMNSMRNLMITGLSLFLGISIPQFFVNYWDARHYGLVHTNAGWSTHS